MGDASTLNANRASWHQLLIVLVGQHPAIKGLEKSKNHRHKLGETLISLGRHRAILRGFCGLVTRDLQDDGPVRPQVDRHPARLRSRWRTIQGSRGGRIALSASDRGASTRRTRIWSPIEPGGAGGRYGADFENR